MNEDSLILIKYRIDKILQKMYLFGKMIVNSQINPCFNCDFIKLTKKELIFNNKF